MVNNAGKVSLDPIKELQNCIDKKNKKVAAYKQNCIKCFLLIYVPTSRYGNYCSFGESSLKHKYNSMFDNIFLFEEKTKKSYILN